MIKYYPFVAYLMLVLLGFKEFHLWDQVIHLWERDAIPLKLILHPHGLRYLLVYPVFALSKISGIHYDLLFSAIIPLLILLSTIVIIKSIKTITQIQLENIFFSLLSLVLFSLSYFMNGRLIFAITASSLLVFLLMSWESRSLISSSMLILLIFMLSSVSSGTFFVATLSFSALFVWKSLSSSQTYLVKTLSLVLFSTVLYQIFPLLKILFFKNLDFYGEGLNGLINMLNHGLGAYLVKINLVIILSFLFILVAYTILFSLNANYFKKILIPIFLSMNSIIGGIFGISTLMMIIPPAIITISYLLIKTKIRFH